MSAPVALTLHGLGLALPVAFSGRGAAEAEAAVRGAWDRCLTATVEPNGPGAPRLLAPLEVALGDAADLAPARARGAVAATRLADVMHHLSPAVTMRLLEGRAGELVLLHAAALADPVTRRTAVLVAPSGTGKTTLTRTLGRELGYLSDETAGVDAAGRVVAYPKPLSVIPRPGEPVKEQVSPSALGLGEPPAAPVLGAVVLLERSDDGPSAPEVTVEPTLSALAALAGQTSYLARVPQPLHRLAALLHQVGGLRRVRYRESATLAPLLAEWLA